MEGASADAPKSARKTVRRAVFVLPMIATGVIASGRGRSSNEFTNGMSLSSEAAEKHSDTEELPLRAWMYIS